MMVAALNRLYVLQLWARHWPADLGPISRLATWLVFVVGLAAAAPLVFLVAGLLSVPAVMAGPQERP